MRFLAFSLLASTPGTVRCDAEALVLGPTTGGAVTCGDGSPVVTVGGAALLNLLPTRPVPPLLPWGGKPAPVGGIGTLNVGGGPCAPCKLLRSCCT